VYVRENAGTKLPNASLALRIRTIDIITSIRNAFEGTYTLRILENFVDLLIAVGPYILISIGLNVGVARFFRGRTITFSRTSELLSIVSAALIGLVSPLPTYAAIPVGLSLLQGGIPFSAIMAFVVSSPLMNPSIFFLTATQLGMEMALVRTFTAFVLGMVAGICTMKLPTLALAPVMEAAQSHPQSPPRPLATELYRNTLYVGKYFSIALLLSAAVKALIPPQAIAGLLGTNSNTGTLIAIGMGIPFYTCGGAAIPFMQTLMSLGMSKGATLAFFTAGPATKLETLYAFKTMLGNRVLIFYLLLAMSFSFVAGRVYSLF
jgi:uncharacterized protein